MNKKGQFYHGTLKAKEHIRKAIEHSQKDHSDDIFDTTPMRNQTQDLNVSLDEEDDYLFRVT